MTHNSYDPSFNSDDDAKSERMRYVYQKFGEEIDKLVNSNYPEEVKQQAKQKLLDDMNKMFE
ncbi:MAG TPA: hypothetical protein DDZ60_08890 [Planktothrix sp. UBA10369]|jgi:hypothetical protein|nr:hypothetical protein [Microcoleaceae cyanobacterium UBA11344]HBK22602.1 hypothetical protein [Planktothrix sp. UBA10369]